MVNTVKSLEQKHWLLIAGFLTATGSVLSGLHGWAELGRPAIVGGLLGQLAVMIGAVFTGAPTKTDPQQ